MVDDGALALNLYNTWRPQKARLPGLTEQRLEVGGRSRVVDGCANRYPAREARSLCDH
jgi:hypothetical protein